MTELNILEMFNHVWSALVSTNGLKLIGIELILLIVFAIANKFVKEKIVKYTFILAELLVLVFYIYDSVNCFQIFLNNVVTNIMEIIYFPTPLELFIVLVISYAVSYFFNKKSDNFILKALNYLVPMINTCLVVAMIKYIDIKSVSFDEFSVFTNKSLMSLNEIVMILFVVWLSVLFVAKINGLVLAKLESKKAVEAEEPELVTVHIDALDEPNFVYDEEEGEIEMPRLKASYTTYN
jgi:hypothetical protein